MRDRSTFETRMQTRDSKTQRGYKVALDAFDVWLDGRTITPENAEDTLQEYVIT